VFARGASEGLRVDRKNRWQCEWFDLVKAYGEVKQRTDPVVHMVRDRMVMSLDSALSRVSAILGVALDWMELRDFLPPTHEGEWGNPRLRRSALASSFVAVLELARVGKAEIAQDEEFGPLLLKVMKL
jgi:segregation and condensation protein A